MNDDGNISAVFIDGPARGRLQTFPQGFRKQYRHIISVHSFSDSWKLDSVDDLFADVMGVDEYIYYHHRLRFPDGDFHYLSSNQSVSVQDMRKIVELKLDG